MNIKIKTKTTQHEQTLKQMLLSCDFMEEDVDWEVDVFLEDTEYIFLEQKLIIKKDMLFRNAAPKIREFLIKAQRLHKLKNICT